MSRKRKPRHFTAKDAARCVAYARRDNPGDDLLIAKYVIDAYGLANVPCMLSQGVLILSNVVFVTATLGVLAGLLRALKGFKIVIEGRISKVTPSPTEHIIRKFFPEFQEMYGAILLFTGSAISIVSTMIALVDSMVDQLEYYAFLDDVCQQKSRPNPYPITPRTPDFEVFLKDDYLDKSKMERFNELADSIFPDS
jgi:hypothetical protein